MHRAFCYSCRQAVPHVGYLDAKPTPTFWLWLVEMFSGQRNMLRYAGDHGYEFDHLECADCYGPAYICEPGMGDSEERS